MVNETNNIRGSNPPEPMQLKDMKVKAPAAVNKVNAYSNQGEKTTDDTIRLSDLSKKMPEYEAKAKSASDIDIERVQDIKASLEEGSYQVDSISLAQKLMQDDLQF